MPQVRPSLATLDDPLIGAVARLSVVPRILDAVVRRTGMRFAAVARVTDNRWTACAVRDDLGFGLGAGDDLVLGSTICDEIRQHHEPVVFGHASAHPVYADHHTPRFYQLESYASVPIFTVDGQFFGTLCAIDSRPVTLDEKGLAAEMTLFGELIAAQLALEDRVNDAEQALREEVDDGVLREQFLAVVGHDLRSPVQAAGMAAESLQSMNLPPRAQRLAGLIAASTRRMAGLIDDVMDFARARLAAGIPVTMQVRDDLAEAAERVLAEIRQAHPEADIRASWSVSRPLRFDLKRMQQLIANLVNNAITHGDSRRPILVEGKDEGCAVTLAVTNFGEPIDPQTLDRLFHPFFRPDSSQPRPGLGLGLYIAAEIARGHGATLTVTSSAEAGTCFLFRMPTTLLT
ncbi:GAF domain-containing sensor histidine kinase [Luteibacter sp. 9135]|uniref:GAF domain-containing sensor histidine kinase n=1 Tax=Luteibacter sp. 9135 TaxID=1500893 RepID=UPI00055BE9E1|nr:GAF domain-containing sensor histidine kinase [Luteibacter sp. 9135]